MSRPVRPQRENRAAQRDGSRAAPPPPPEPDLGAAVHRRASRMQRWLHEGDPSLMRQLATVGVLGWIIVVPALLGVLLGRWIDRLMGGGIFFTAPLLLLGIVVGAWAAWRWMHEQ